MPTKKPSKRKEPAKSKDGYAVSELVRVGKLTVRITGIAGDGLAEWEWATPEDRLRRELQDAKTWSSIAWSLVSKRRRRAKVAELRKIPDRQRRQTVAARAARARERKRADLKLRATVKRLAERGLSDRAITEYLARAGESVGRARVARLRKT